MCVPMCVPFDYPTKCPVCFPPKYFAATPCKATQILLVLFPSRVTAFARRSANQKRPTQIEGKKMSSIKVACLASLGLLVIGTGGAAALGDPLVHLTLQGRISGSADPFGGLVTVAPGQTVDYRVVAQ